MSTKIIAIVLVAVIAVAGIGAVALMGGGDEPSTPIPGGEDAIGYAVSLDKSTFGAEVESVDCPEGLKATISGTGDSQKITIEGIPKGETPLKVTFVDGKVLDYILKRTDDGVRLIGERHDGSDVDDKPSGYTLTLNKSDFGAEVKSIDCPDGLKATITGKGDSQKITIEGIPNGETPIKVVYTDGKVLDFTLKATGDGVRLVGEKHDGSDVDDKKTYVPENSSNWFYWTGNLDSPGVSDALTPISKNDMKELWKVQAQVDTGSTNWKTPGSAVCIGEHTYYYNLGDSRLHCVVTSTGIEKASVYIKSGSVYNMTLAYGDGKIFVPTLVDNCLVLKAYDAETLKQLFVSEPVSGYDNNSGVVVYYEGKVFIGTYNGYFACFDGDDIDTTRSDEVISPRWLVDGNGWYNMIPAFFGGHCVIVEKGYDIGGAIAYSVDTETGAIIDKIEFDREYCVSAPASYDGRVYIALNRVTDRSIIEPSPEDPKTLVLRSYVVGLDGKFDRSSEKEWFSSATYGGTQSIPIIWNHRLYIGGGGSTLGTDEPFNVIDIAFDGTMTLAYSVSNLKSKGTASITTAYSQSSNGDAVYIYMLEYGHVNPGEDLQSTNGYSEIFCLKDTVGQKKADVVFKLRPSVDQFAFQSFTISPDGYVLIRNDSTLFCYGNTSRNYGVDELKKAIDRIVSDSKEGDVNPADVQRAEYRYSLMTESEKARVTNYQALQDLYRTVTFSVDGKQTDVRILVGSTVIVPPVQTAEGRSLTGWTYGDAAWNLNRDRVSGDMTLEAVMVSQYKVSFDSNGGSAIQSIWVSPAVPMGYVPVPTRSGYSFDGWSCDGKRYVPQESMIAGDITLSASWLKNSRISFDSNGGTSASSISVTQNRPIGELPVVKKSGYSFMGWYLDDKQFVAGMEYPYEKDIKLKATWLENKIITIEKNGLSVTAKMPEDATIMFAKISSNIGTISNTKLKAAAGNDCEIYNLKVHGDGVDNTHVLTLGLPVGKSFNGKELKVYYYLSEGGGKVLSVSGTVVDGILTVDIIGNKATNGSEPSLAIRPGTELSKHQVL